MNRTGPGLTTGVALLERAISYALPSVEAVADPDLCRPTPCAGWDLRTLLRHVNDSVGVLREGIDTGAISALPAGCADVAADLVSTFRNRAQELLGAWIAAGIDDIPITVADAPLPASIVAGTGAIEIAVHGWDIARACGDQRPIPAELALDMLLISPRILTGPIRGTLFAPPVAISPLSNASDRLVAFLGRHPDA